MEEAGYKWDVKKKELEKIESKSAASLKDDIEWLKSLKNGVQPKQEWSEEDKEMIDAVIGDIQFTQKAHNHEVNQVVYERKIDWLKSLKQRLNGTE